MSNIDDELENGLDEDLEDINYEEFVDFLNGATDLEEEKTPEEEMPEAPSLNFSMLLERIKKRDEMLANLNNPTTKYNEDTERRFAQFAKDLLTLYPGIGKYLSEKDIINRLKANIAEDIIYEDDLGTSEVGDTKLIAGGVFYNQEKQVRIKKDVSELEKSIYIFHEFIHALVEDNPFADYDTNDNYVGFENEEDQMFIEDFDSIFSNFVMEAITTLLQEDYERKILGIKRSRVNGYLPVYARELKAIFGDSFIEDYIVHFKYIKPILRYFYSGDKKISIKSLTDNNDLIEKLIRMKNSDAVAGKNSNIEMTLTLLLDKYLSENHDLSDEEKLERISIFLREQIVTDFDYIKGIIERNIRDKSLIDKYPLVCYAYNVTDENSIDLKNQIVGAYEEQTPGSKDELRYDLKNLSIKYDEYTIRKFFGFTSYSYDLKTRMLVYDGAQLQSFEKYKHLYNALYRLHKKGLINDEELVITSVKGDTSESKHNVKDQLLTGNTGADYSAFDTLSSLKQLLKDVSGGMKLSSLFSGHAIIDDSKSTHYMKVSADIDYYVITDNFRDDEVRFPMSIDNAIEFYMSLSDENPDIKGGFLLAIEELKKLNSQGVSTVFVNEYGIIHEDGQKGETVTIIFEDDECPAELVRETFELEDLDMVFAKRDVKEI